jgi:hypothetical protein
MSSQCSNEKVVDPWFNLSYRLWFFCLPLLNSDQSSVHTELWGFMKPKVTHTCYHIIEELKQAVLGAITYKAGSHLGAGHSQVSVRIRTHFGRSIHTVRPSLGQDTVTSTMYVPWCQAVRMLKYLFWQQYVKKLRKKRKESGWWLRQPPSQAVFGFRAADVTSAVIGNRGNNRVAWDKSCLLEWLKLSCPRPDRDLPHRECFWAPHRMDSFHTWSKMTWPCPVP